MLAAANANTALPAVSYCNTSEAADTKKRTIHCPFKWQLLWMTVVLPSKLLSRQRHNSLDCMLITPVQRVSRERPRSNAVQEHRL